MTGHTKDIAPTLVHARSLHALIPSEEEEEGHTHSILSGEKTTQEEPRQVEEGCWATNASEWQDRQATHKVEKQNVT